jgi:hypothetical protein
MKKCKECGEEFFQYKTTQKFCIECAIKIGREKLDSDGWKKRKKVLEEKTETVKDCMIKLQKTINHIARLIDREQSCISCVGKVEQGGHYYPSGNNKNITFNLHNIHGQCVHCNMHLSANLIEYRLGLTARYGAEYTEYIESLRQVYKDLKHDKEELKIAHTKAYKILKELQRQGSVYTKREQQELREQYNKEIGIYK